MRVPRGGPFCRLWEWPGGSGGKARRSCYVITSEIRDPCVSWESSSGADQVIQTEVKWLEVIGPLEQEAFRLGRLK